MTDDPDDVCRCGHPRSSHCPQDGGVECSSGYCTAECAAFVLDPRAPPWGAVLYGPPELATTDQAATLVELATLTVTDDHGGTCSWVQLVSAANAWGCGLLWADEATLRAVASVAPSLREQADGTWVVA